MAGLPNPCSCAGYYQCDHHCNSPALSVISPSNAPQLHSSSPQQTFTKQQSVSLSVTLTGSNLDQCKYGVRKTNKLTKDFTKQNNSFRTKRIE